MKNPLLHRALAHLWFARGGSGAKSCQPTGVDPSCRTPDRLAGSLSNQGWPAARARVTSLCLRGCCFALLPCRRWVTYSPVQRPGPIIPGVKSSWNPRTWNQHLLIRKLHTEHRRRAETKPARNIRRRNIRTRMVDRSGHFRASGGSQGSPCPHGPASSAL